MHPPSVVRDFDYEFRHLALFFRELPTQNLTAQSTILSPRPTPKLACGVPQVTCLLSQFSLDDLSTRRSPKIEPSVRDRHILFLICKAIFGRRPVYSLNDQASNPVLGRDLQDDLVHPVC